MPLEIRELVIKATVNDSEPGAGSGGPSAAGSQQGTETIVQVCVEKVLEILREKAER